MSGTSIKIAIAAVLAVLGSAIDVVALPFLVLCVLMASDYLTGLVKSWHLGTLCSRTGIKGFVKKLCYGLAVIAAAGVDYVMVYCCQLAGKDFGYHPLFVLLIIAWLSINECISILENLLEIGVPLPSFLIKAAKRLKSNVEEKGDA